MAKKSPKRGSVLAEPSCSIAIDMVASMDAKGGVFSPIFNVDDCLPIRLPPPAPADPLVYFTDEDWSIVTHLATHHPRLLTQEDLEGCCRESRRPVSLRTIQNRLPKLLKKGIVVQPEGARSGWGLTELGLRLAR